MQILFPVASPDLKRLDSSHVTLSAASVIETVGVLKFRDPVDCYVQYDYPKIFSRHALNVVAVDFTHHVEDGVVMFFRDYGNLVIACPYKSRHIRRLTFNPEFSKDLHYCGPH